MQGGHPGDPSRVARLKATGYPNNVVQPRLQLNDPNSPARLTLKWDVTVVRPRGGAKIYIKKGDNPSFLAPNCLQHGVANPSPCVGSRQRLQNGDLKVTVLLLSGDPLCGKH